MLGDDFFEDVHWIIQYLDMFNGVAFINKQPEVVEDLLVDACLTGAGGTLGNKWFSATFPNYIIEQQLNISELELLTILAAVRIFIY